MYDFEVDRRNFVAGGLVIGLLPLCTPAGAKDIHGPVPRTRPQRLHKLLVDRTIPESVKLGSYARDIADEVFLFDGDLTALWTNELRSQWPKGPRAIAGLTTPSVQMVFEQLGRDHGARIVFSAEHSPKTRDMRHRLIGCETVLRDANLRGDHDWVADMAKHIVACSHEPQSTPVILEYETAVPAGLSENQHRLVTWVLAPVPSTDQHNTSETVRS